MPSFWLLLEKIHGHLGLLSLALCLHPPFALRRARRPAWRTRLAGLLASAGVILVNVSGWYIYPEYRGTVKLTLYRHERFWGVLFEVKEHLGWYALALAAVGVMLMLAADGTRGADLRRPIVLVYGAMAVLVTAVAVMGVLISSVHGFPDALQALPSGP
jgi:predicted membrane protein